MTPDLQKDDSCISPGGSDGTWSLGFKCSDHFPANSHSLVTKRTGHKADHSSIRNLQVKNGWSYTSTPP